MKILLQVLVIILIISTIAICISKPDMHKTIVVYDSAYVVVSEKQKEIEKETIPIMQKTVEPQKTVQKTEQKIKKELETKPKVESKTITKTNTKQKKPSTEHKKTTNVTVKVNTDRKTTPAVTQATTKKENTNSNNQITQKISPQPVKNTLTQQEESVVWNIWRSNIQNKIMQDTKLPILPTGVVFKFSFTVDKYGKISNLQTWSETSSYTPYAIQYIAPVIRSYQGRSILNFPSGTAREVTEVKGGWRISTNEKYSTPSDYNDVEKVIK